MLSVLPGLRGMKKFHVGRKMENFQFFLSVRGTGGSPTGPHSENRVGDQHEGSPEGSVSSGLHVPSEARNFGAWTRNPWWNSHCVFPSKCPSNAPAEMSNTPRWWFGFLEDNQWGGCRLDLKNRGENFPADFCTWNILGRGKPLCRQSIDCCFVPGP